MTAFDPKLGRSWFLRLLGEQMHTDDDGNLVEFKVGRDAHHEFCPGECHTGTIYREWDRLALRPRQRRAGT